MRILLVFLGLDSPVIKSLESSRQQLVAKNSPTNSNTNKKISYFRHSNYDANYGNRVSNEIELIIA